MHRIWKYTLTPKDIVELDMPKGASPLTVQVQGEEPQLWAIVDDQQTKRERRRFRVVGTGHPFHEAPDSNPQYVGTFQLYGGGLVFHVFELVDPTVLLES